jgi:hypothetical protein
LTCDGISSAITGWPFATFFVNNPDKRLRGRQLRGRTYAFFDAIVFW